MAFRFAFARRCGVCVCLCVCRGGQGGFGSGFGSGLGVGRAAAAGVVVGAASAAARSPPPPPPPLLLAAAAPRSSRRAFARGAKKRFSPLRAFSSPEEYEELFTKWQQQELQDMKEHVPYDSSVLDNRVKKEIYRRYLHDRENGTLPALASTYGMSVGRIAAIVALESMEAQAVARGEDLSVGMEFEEAHIEAFGVREDVTVEGETSVLHRDEHEIFRRTDSALPTGLGIEAEAATGEFAVAHRAAENLAGGKQSAPAGAGPRPRAPSHELPLEPPPEIREGYLESIPLDADPEMLRKFLPLDDNLRRAVGPRVPGLKNARWFVFIDSDPKVADDVRDITVFDREDLTMRTASWKERRRVLTRPRRFTWQEWLDFRLGETPPPEEEEMPYRQMGHPSGQRNFFKTWGRVYNPPTMDQPDPSPPPPPFEDESEDGSDGEEWGNESDDDFDEGWEKSGDDGTSRLDDGTPARGGREFPFDY